MIASYFVQGISLMVGCVSRLDVLLQPFAFVCGAVFVCDPRTIVVGGWAAFGVAVSGSMRLFVTGFSLVQAVTASARWRGVSGESIGLRALSACASGFCRVSAGSCYGRSIAAFNHC